MRTMVHLWSRLCMCSGAVIFLKTLCVLALIEHTMPPPMRRPQRKRRIRSTNIILSPQERQIKNRMSHANTLLEEMPPYDDHKERWDIFLAETAPEFIVGFSRHAFRKKELWKRFRDSDEDNALALWNMLFWNSSNNVFVFRPKELREYFTIDDGLDEVYFMIDDIIKTHKNKTYMDDDEKEKEEDHDALSKALALFEIPETEQPTRKYLMTFYKKKALEVHPDKHPQEEKEKWAAEFSLLSSSFTLLLERYCSS